MITLNPRESIYLWGQSLLIVHIPDELVPYGNTSYVKEINF